MYLQANPGRARSGEEKEEMKRKYTPGENVLPKIKRRKEGREEAEDRRMVEEVREMSLRDVGLRGTGSYERGVRHRIRDGAAGTPDEAARQRRGHSGDGERPPTASDAASQARRIEHQSSLRSLLSSSDIDSSEMQEEILRQITEDGLLDGIDLNNMDISQEDELSEKIADAYRRRHGRRSRPREGRSDDPGTESSRDPRSAQERQHHRPGRSPSSTDQIAHASHHPPLSRPHLLEAYPTGHSHRRRTSSESRRQTSPIPSSASRRDSSETPRQAARSATDLTNRPRSSSNSRAPPVGLSSGGRRTTDPNALRPRGVSRDRNLQAHRSPDSRPRETEAMPSSQPIAASSLPSHTSIEPGSSTTASSAAENGDRHVHHLDSPRSTHTDIARTSTDTRETLASYAEPEISCDRCGKQSIEYDLHWNCSKCYDGKYNLCKHCYITSCGCLHWYGFGHATMQRYKIQEPQAGYPQDHPLPHRLDGHCYLRPPPSSLQPATPGSRLRTSSDPKKRLQSGPFCSNCSNFTPGCYWMCELCNEGEWGFCNPCVNQAKCCTHALLPVTYFNSNSPSRFPLANLSPNTPVNTVELPAMSSADVGRPDQVLDERCVPLTFSTKCDICRYPIPPSTTRFHCPECHAGDYDIDATCYRKLVHNGKISAENGPKGWRRCPNGHRMIVVGFEDSNLGHRRIVVDDLVGGQALKDDANADGSLEWSWREGQQRQGKTVSKASTGRITAVSESPADDGTPPLFKKYPPNGGVGMHILALWSWWPKDGAEDELAFPKGAEIRECEDINGDWFWGVYCARKGLFPSNYGRVIETVTM